MLLDTPPGRPTRLGRFGLPTDRPLRWTLAAGVLLRLLLFKPLYPVNNDDHFAVISYLLQHHRLPTADLVSQAYHPPLYYLLAAPFAALARLRGAELLSLGLSVFNLWLLARPTALAFIGFGRVLGGLREVARVPELSEPRYVALGRRVTAVGLLLATLGIVIAAGVRYDVWSSFQGRLLFPALFAGLLLMSSGYDGEVAWRAGTRRWLDAAFVTAYAAWGWYYVLMIASAMRTA